MGDRTYWYEPCPKCGEQVEFYDAYSSLMFVAVCDNCGWKDDRDYYETGENEISLLTPKQLKALKKKNPEVKEFMEHRERILRGE